MDIRPIKIQADYKAALEETERLFDAEPDTPEGDRLEVSAIAAWYRSGRLDGIRATPRGYWWIKLTPEIIAELRKPVRQRWKTRSSK